MPAPRPRSRPSVTHPVYTFLLAPLCAPRDAHQKPPHPCRFFFSLTATCVHFSRPTTTTNKKTRTVATTSRKTQPRLHPHYRPRSACARRWATARAPTSPPPTERKKKKREKTSNLVSYTRASSRRCSANLAVGVSSVTTMHLEKAAKHFSALTDWCHGGQVLACMFQWAADSGADVRRMWHVRQASNSVIFFFLPLLTRSLSPHGGGAVGRVLRL